MGKKIIFTVDKSGKSVAKIRAKLLKKYLTFANKEIPIDSTDQYGNQLLNLALDVSLLQKFLNHEAKSIDKSLVGIFR
jgi:hypothetical protein